jgi:ParB-like chromosome segregation protein Spo0J
MEIILINVNDLIEYEKNAKLHPDYQIDQIIKSIKEFGFNDPIAIDQNNMIIEGHGRLLAAKKMGMEEVPVIKLDHLTDQQKKAYILAHNKITMNSGFDLDILKEEINDIEFFDMTDFGFLKTDFEHEFTILDENEHGLLSEDLSERCETCGQKIA